MFVMQTEHVSMKTYKQNNNQTYKAKALKRVFIPKKQKNKKRKKISLRYLLRRINVSKDWTAAKLECLSPTITATAGLSL